MNLLKRLFGKRSDGKCRWWQHEYEEWEIEFTSGTGKWIGETEIKVKYVQPKMTCKKCGNVWYGDARRKF